MIVSFECERSEKLEKAIDNYLHPNNTLLQLTDDLYVENKVYYFDNVVLIVQTSFFDIVAQYFVYFGVMGLLFSWLVDTNQFFRGIPYISFLVVLICLVYLSAKVRFYLLKWRINKVVDKDIQMKWLSKEHVINRFIIGVKNNGSARNFRAIKK